MVIIRRWLVLRTHKQLRDQGSCSIHWTQHQPGNRSGVHAEWQLSWEEQRQMTVAERRRTPVEGWEQLQRFGRRKGLRSGEWWRLEWGELWQGQWLNQHCSCFCWQPFCCCYCCCCCYCYCCSKLWWWWLSWCWPDLGHLQRRLSSKLLPTDRCCRRWFPPFERFGLHCRCCCC